MSEEPPARDALASYWTQLFGQDACDSGPTQESGGTEPPDVADKTVRPPIVEKEKAGMDEFLGEAFAAAAQDSSGSAFALFEDYVEELGMKGTSGNEYKEAFATRNLMTRPRPFAPSELLDRILPQRVLDEIQGRQKHWFDKQHAHRTISNCKMAYSQQERQGRKYVLVLFEVTGDFKPAVTRRTGVVPNSAKLIPSIELMFALVEDFVKRGIRMKSTHKMLRKFLWVPNRMVVSSLYRFYTGSKQSRERKKPPALHIEGSRTSPKQLLPPPSSQPMDAPSGPIQEGNPCDSPCMDPVHDALQGAHPARYTSMEQAKITHEVVNPSIPTPKQTEPGPSEVKQGGGFPPVGEPVSDAGLEEMIWKVGARPELLERILMRMRVEGKGEDPKPLPNDESEPVKKKLKATHENEGEYAGPAQTTKGPLGASLDPQQTKDVAGKFRTLFVHTTKAQDLLERAKHPESNKKLAQGRLLTNILNVDKWSNQDRPTEMIKTALEAALQGNGPMQVARVMLQKVLEASTKHTSVEQIVAKLHNTARVNGRRPEWLTRIGQHEKIGRLEKRILQPLGLCAVGVSGAGNLCIIRTFAFLILINEGRLPPFCWRLTAYVAFTAFLMLGCGDGQGNPRVLNPQKSSLEPAMLEQLGHRLWEWPQRRDEFERSVRWPLMDEEHVPLSMTLDDSLEALILGFFAKKTPEKQGEVFGLDKGLDYATLHVLPAMTGKPFLVVRTVGPIVDDCGNVYDANLARRDSAKDKVAVFDVFHVKDTGQREVCTYGSYEEAQAELGGGTPYIAFWTQLTDLSHLEPIVTKEIYAKLPEERVLVP
eukprot:scaffold410_cov446-Pavlova_lutheri.AAC.1